MGWGYEGSVCAAGNLDCEVAGAEISAGVKVLAVSLEVLGSLGIEGSCEPVPISHPMAGICRCWKALDP